jgi:protein TonB
MKRKKSKPESFIQKPLYPGGKKALDEFIRSNLQYPEEALKQKAEGSVKIAYDVNVFGEVSHAVIKGGIGHGCDEEALRLVKMLRFEKKKYRGLHVIFHNTILIHFYLPGKVVKKEEQQQLNIVYHYKEK